jgi:hypothetical protein
MTEVYLMSRPREITSLEYRSRFTQDERSAIYTAAKSDVVVQAILDDLSAVQEGMINLDDARTRQALEYFVSVSILTEDRMQDILK